MYVAELRRENWCVHNLDIDHNVSDNNSKIRNINNENHHYNNMKAPKTMWSLHKLGDVQLSDESLELF